MNTKLLTFRCCEDLGWRGVRLGQPFNVNAGESGVWQLLKWSIIRHS